MKSVDKRVFRIVSGVHIALLVVLFSYGLVSGCFRRPPDRVIPVEFMVDVRPASDEVESAMIEPEETEPDPPVDPEPDPPTPQPDPPPRRQIQVNTNRVVRRLPEQETTSPTENPLTEEEIREMLAAGATASDRTSIPDEDGRGLVIIRNTLYAIWDAPSRAAVGDAEATLELRLGSGGVVQSTRLLQPSGNPVLDESVEKVGGRIGRIHGLPSGFVERRPRVTIAFSVE